jgi:hypothetical protein
MKIGHSCTALLVHCGAAMQCKETMTASSERLGTEVMQVAVLTCDCGAVVVVTVTEPA